MREAEFIECTPMEEFDEKKREKIMENKEKYQRKNHRKRINEQKRLRFFSYGKS